MRVINGNEVRVRALGCRVGSTGDLSVIEGARRAVVLRWWAGPEGRHMSKKVEVGRCRRRRRSVGGRQSNTWRLSTGRTRHVPRGDPKQ
jgi:hypothetical protein